MDRLLITHKTAYRFWIGGPKRPHPDASRQSIGSHDHFVAKNALLSEARRLLTESALDTQQPLDVCVFNRANRRAFEGANCHLLAEPIQRNSICKLSNSIFIASPEMLFLMLAQEASIQELIAYGNSLCSTYPVIYERYTPVDERKPLTTIKKLSEFLNSNKGASGVKKASTALQWVSEGAASQREATFATIFFTPRCYGGFGIPKAKVNYRVDFDEIARRMSGQEFAIVDFAWPEAMLVVEYDSDECHGALEKLAADSLRRNALIRMGYQVIVVTNQMISKESGRDSIAQMLSGILYKKGRRKYNRMPTLKQALLDSAFRAPSARI